MYEVEIKASLINPEKTIEKIKQMGISNSKYVIYNDVYLDHLGKFAISEEELRIRKKEYSETGEITTILTYKSAPFHSETKSKQEHEIQVSDFAKTIEIFQHLGYNITVQFQKKCTVFCTNYKNQSLEITIAEILLLNQHFIEIESKIDNLEKTEETLQGLYEYLEAIGISQKFLTNQYYTDAVKSFM